MRRYSRRKSVRCIADGKANGKGTCAMKSACGSLEWWTQTDGLIRKSYLQGMEGVRKGGARLVHPNSINYSEHVKYFLI